MAQIYKTMTQWKDLFHKELGLSLKKQGHSE